MSALAHPVPARRSPVGERSAQQDRDNEQHRGCQHRSGTSAKWIAAGPVEDLRFVALNTQRE
jgi:hypothetical protein